jgi:signal transduction histidine kinase/purine-cytosine permease-like protein
MRLVQTIFRPIPLGLSGSSDHPWCIEPSTSDDVMILGAIKARRSYQAWVANETMEDYALRYAPRSFRKWSPFTISNTALGGISFLALEAIGGTITISYGFVNAFPAIIAVSILVFITNLPIAYYSSRYNIDMDLLTRGAGFGYIGSTITSLIYAGFTFIFFALEAAIMAQALGLFFGLPIVVGYIISSIVIIPLAFLGITWISKFQLITQPVWAIMLVTPFFFIFWTEPQVFREWINFAGRRPEAAGFNVLYFGAATGVLFSLVVQIGEQVDYLRFLPDITAQTRRRWWAAVVSAGPGWIVIGCLKILAGSLLAVLAVRAGLSYSDAVEPIHMYISAYEFVSPNPLIVLTAATVFVLISQVKINVTNAYAGSLAWSNFYSRVTHYHPGRVVWLVFNILISLLLMLLGVFQTLELVLAVYSNVAIAWIGAIFADLVVLKPLGISPSFIEFKRAHLYNINPVGCGAMAIASMVSITAFAGTFGPFAEAYSAGISLSTAFVVGILLGVITKGRYYIARSDTLSDKMGSSDRLRCVICNYDYESRDMALCPFYEGAVCSLCCSLEAHCHEICKSPLGTKILPNTLADVPHFRRMIAPDLVRRLMRFFGVVAALAAITAAVFLLTYRLTELNTSAPAIDGGRLLFRIYLAAFVLICVGAWWIVLAQDSRELAERDLVTSLEKLTETRQELMQNERLAAIGQLMATVSHELRNPLGTVVSSMAVLRRYIDDPAPPVREEIDRMQRNIWRCVSIIEDLLAFSRNKTLVLEPVKIDQWIGSQLEEHEFAHQVRLKMTLFSQATVLIDSKLFRQAFINVVQNAQQAIVMPQEVNLCPGEITIGTSTSDGQLVLQITDNGIGIPPEQHQKIFTPLFSTKTYGVGLGLPLVKRIVEQHNGRIEVASEWKKGTTVTIWLPLPSSMKDIEHGPSVQTQRPSGATELGVAT